MKISNHAKQRLKERCGLQKKSLDRMAQRAFEQGIAHAQTKGRLNKWITKLYFQHRTASKVRIYGEKCYLFDRNETLITVMDIPNDLKKALKEMIKEK